MNAKRRLGHVLQRRTADQTQAMTDRIEHFVRARQRAGVRNRLALAHFRAAELNHENRFAFVERLLGDGHELVGAANAFDHQTL